MVPSSFSLLQTLRVRNEHLWNAPVLFILGECLCSQITPEKTWCQGLREVRQLDLRQRLRSDLLHSHTVFSYSDMLTTSHVIWCSHWQCMRHSWETACGGIESRENSCVCHPGNMVRVRVGQLLLLSGHCDGGDLMPFSPFCISHHPTLVSSRCGSDLPL